MALSYPDKIQAIKKNPALLRSLGLIQRGLEKESLRITPEGKLALTPHPQSLGSALCHPAITTDYSESLLEFITPVHQSIGSCLADLNEIHHFTYHNLAAQNELLWTASMPCQLVKSADIPIAQYGNSNVAKMKTVYRHGLGHRYGKIMQTISGIHYNFSLPEKFMAKYQQLLADNSTMQDFKTSQYLGLIRNFHRHVPIFIYLFGSSPAICRSFLQGQSHQLATDDDHSWYGKHATSLRMGDLGYQSKAQQNLFICYNSLENYISSLREAITKPFDDYENIGLKDANGDYKQLNTALLQIENEFYSTIRPKRVTASGEAPINALSRRGIEYVEVRCVDIDPFSAVGIDETTMQFLDVFLLYCLLQDSPELLDQECHINGENLRTIVDHGRRPGVMINHNGNDVDFISWCSSLLDNMSPIAIMLDSLFVGDDYQASLEKQRHKLVNPELTPSAQVLRTMELENISFAEFIRRQSIKWQSHFLKKKQSKNRRKVFEKQSMDSLAQQETIEAADQLPFDIYLKDFYQQYYD